ncbi:MAG: hypothetical protein H7Z14_11250, partial [Anaerolineae bacterium]|nr:hypothetical protein [Phycisphaerae bacterium]
APAVPAPAAAPTPPSAPAPAEEKGALKFVASTSGVKLLAPISVGKAAAESKDDVEQELPSGKAFMKSKKIARLELKMVEETLEEVGAGNGKVSTLYIPTGKMMVQVKGTAVEADPWRWAEHLSEIEAIDDKGAKYKPNGALAKATKDGKVYLVGKYDAENAPSTVDKQDGVTPTEVHLFFILPEKTVIKSITYQGEKMSDIKAPASTQAHQP